MAVEVVTIVNSSGKIINNGKNVWSVLKEAKASYDEKKAQMKAEKADKSAEPRSINDTYEIVPPASEYEDEQPLYTYGAGSVRRASHPVDDDARSDARSYASSQRSHRTKHSSRTKASRRTALTMDNLKTLSEVSSEAPSRAPIEYRQPYAETAPWETQLSRPSLAHSRTIAAPSVSRAPSQYPVQYADEYDDRSYYEDPRYYQPVQRSRSDGSINVEGLKKSKEIDMNLAYGNVPPDLADRVDLDPAYKEREARSLMEKIESMLTEAHCLHHSANHMIKHLQENPQVAASVALSLGELSTLVGKMSPAFLGVIKGGSPAIFALLASPQFLVATGAAAGLSAVMFGGWKIVKKIKAEEAARALPMAFEAQALPAAPSQAPRSSAPDSKSRAPYPVTADGYDEAIEIDDDLSSIDTWRRGIAPMGEDESVDMELISPEAHRAIKSQYGSVIDDTRTERSVRTNKTSKTAKSHKSSKTTSSRHTSKSHAQDDSAIPDKKSKVDDGASEAGSVRSHKSHRSSKSTKSTKSTKTSATRKTIEDGSKDKENTLEAIMKPKKDTMLKSLFKKKEKELDLVETASSKNRSASTLKLT